MLKRIYEKEDVISQLQYEIEDRAEYGLVPRIELTKGESLEIANLLYNTDEQIAHLFNQDPETVLNHIDDDHYDWGYFYSQIEDVIKWYKMNPLTKIFQSI